MITLSAIVPATNAPSTLDRCSAALARSKASSDEVIVVDGPPEANAARARNLGADRATGDVLVFVDSDVVVHDDALTRIRQAFERDGELVALFGSYDDAPAGPGVVSAFRNLLHHHVHQSSPGTATSFWTGLGAVRADAFAAVGGFDESVAFMEDIDLGMRLARRPGHIRLDPEILGTHLKTWTFFSMVYTDFAHRAIPWVRLLLRHRHSAGTLNLSWRHRMSAGASVAGAGGVLLRKPRIAIGSAVALVALNRDFYALLARRRGRIQAAAGVLLHAAHHLAGVAGVPVAVAQHLTEKRQPGR